MDELEAKLEVELNRMPLLETDRPYEKLLIGEIDEGRPLVKPKNDELKPLLKRDEGYSWMGVCL